MSSEGLRAPAAAQHDVESLPPDLARLISWTLRIGVTVSAILAVAGLGLLLAGRGSGFDSLVASGAPFSGSGFLTGVVQGNGTDVLFLAFLVLIATPLVRVVLSVVSFARVGDRRFTALTLAVLFLLGLSVLIGAAT